MAYRIEYYDSIDVGIVFREDEGVEEPVVTFSHDPGGSHIWKFTVIPGAAVLTLSRPEIKAAARAFMASRGVPPERP